jgi:pyrroline-5-carboxylate reductase
MLNTLTFGFVGGGNLATALITGLIARGVPAGSIYVADPSEAARKTLADALGVHTTGAPDAAIGKCNVIVMAVKPQQFQAAAGQLQAHLPAGAGLVVSVAAGIRLVDMQRWLGGHARVVRAMPNTPALAGMGMTGLCAPAALGEQDRAVATALADAVGKSVWVEDDAQIDAVTGLSGSGPAYVFYVIEAMQKAAAELGLSEAQGRVLAVETFRGAAALAAESTEPVSLLRERVTSKGGTTFAGLTALEHAGVGAAFVTAIRAAAARGKEMGEEFGKDA